MMAQQSLEFWDLWYPKAAATGMPFARGRIGTVDALLVHAAPPFLTVQIQNGGIVVAEGIDLAATDDTPIARLTRRGRRIEREDIWPTEDDYGRVVLLPGDEAGILKTWWHADDHSEWRWQVEFYNHR